jgi:hypothetical protein
MTWRAVLATADQGLPGGAYRVEIQGILNGKLCGDV